MADLPTSLSAKDLTIKKIEKNKKILHFSEICNTFVTLGMLYYPYKRQKTDVRNEKETQKCRILPLSLLKKASR